MMLEEGVDDIDENDPPMKSVPDVDSEKLELDQHKALILPPGLVIPRGVKLPLERKKRVSPLVENVFVPLDFEEEDAKGEEVENQSKPAKEPPKTTLPILEKST